MLVKDGIRKKIEAIYMGFTDECCRKPWKNVINEGDLKKISGIHNKKICLETHTHSEADWMSVKQRVPTSNRI